MHSENLVCACAFASMYKLISSSFCHGIAALYMSQVYTIRRYKAA